MINSNMSASGQTGESNLNIHCWVDFPSLEVSLQLDNTPVKPLVVGTLPAARVLARSVSGWDCIC